MWLRVVGEKSKKDSRWDSKANEYGSEESQRGKGGSDCESHGRYTELVSGR